MTHKYKAPFTRLTLLNKIKQKNNGRVWADFIDHYCDFIDMIMNKMHVPHSVRDDLNQDIFIKLWKSINDFEYDTNKGSFHNWVGTITRNTLLSYYRKENLQPTLSLDVGDFHSTMSKPSDLDKIIEDEWRIYLCKESWKIISKSCKKSSTIECYNLILKGFNSQEIAQKLSMSADMVYVHRQRFKAKMAEAMGKLKENLESPNFKSL